jgi:hypothetical protein
MYVKYRGYFEKKDGYDRQGRGLKVNQGLALTFYAKTVSMEYFSA